MGSNKRLRKSKSNLWPRTEVELCQELIKWMSAEGWEVFQEVKSPRGYGVADIVGRKGTLTWIIECKKSLNLKVIAQAFNWLRLGHYVSIAVPKYMFNSRNGNVPGVSAQICESFGIGILSVDPSITTERVKAKLHRKNHNSSKAISTTLTEHHKTFTQAGSATGSHWSPFKQTIENLIEVIKKNPGILMKDAIKQIKHHYKSSPIAVNSICKHIQTGVIKSIRTQWTPAGIQLYVQS